MTKRTHILQFRLGLLLLLSLISVASLAALWEFQLEGRVLPALGIPYDGRFEDAERWRFIITSTTFATLSLAIPGLIIRRLVVSLSQGYQAILDARQEAFRLARHDELTGLYNRRIFIEKLTFWLTGESPTAAVMIINLDRFKPINDTYGHAGGDDALCEIAGRLRRFSNKDITVARTGGDEFAVLISGVIGRDELAALGSRICTSLSQPLMSLPHPLSAGVSIGIALFPDDAETADALLRCADTAMYHTKSTERGTFCFYDLSFGTAVRSREQFEREIRSAVLNNEFVPWFQPVISLHSGKISGFEILARWHHPARGLLMPADFISEVDRTGCMPAMTESLLRQACRHFRDRYTDMTLALNIPASMAEDLTLPETIQRLLREEGLPLSRLEIEITEDTLIANMGSARINLDKFRAMGVTVSLDDFGTGYSGLYHLTQLSIDKIKIDRSFIALKTSRKNQMVDAILAMGKSLEMQITAEGIEHMEAARWLSAHGCDFAQGWLFGMPVPADEISGLFTGKALQEFGATLKGHIPLSGDNLLHCPVES